MPDGESLPQVSVYIDDTLITGHAESELVVNVEKVLERLSLAEMRLRQEIFKHFKAFYSKFLSNLSNIEPLDIFIFAQRQEMELELRTRRSIQES